MELWQVVSAAGVVGIALLLFLLARKKRGAEGHGKDASGDPVVGPATAKGVTVDYRSKVYLMSKTERAFFAALQEQLQGEYVIFSKVRLADIVKPISVDGPSWWTAFHQLSSKHIDFVICDPSSLAIVCGIELDDASHDKDERKGRDGFVDETLASAGIPLLRFSASKGVNPQEIRDKFAFAVGPRA